MIQIVGLVLLSAVLALQAVIANQNRRLHKLMATQADAIAKINAQAAELVSLVVPIEAEFKATDSQPILDALAQFDAPLASLKALVPVTPPASS